jgi:rod shape-determining protein MreB
MDSMSLLNRQLAIDMGTSSTRIYIRGKGITLQEPSILARDQENDSILAIGTPAEEMYGRQNEQIIVSRPISSGVITDFGGTEEMLRAFIRRAAGRLFLRNPEAMMSVPSGATSTEQRAVIDVGKRAGLSNVYLIQSGVAAALGAGLPIIEPRGHMIIDIGSGTTEVAVLSLGGVVAVRSVRSGGDTITEAIIRSMFRNFGVLIGAKTSEEVKRLIGTLSAQYESSMTVSGSNTSDGQPKAIDLHSDDIRPYLEASLEKVVMASKFVLEKTSPDLVADVMDRGITLAGGGAHMHGIEDYLTRKLQAQCQVAQDPMLCGVKGAFIALTHLSDYKRSLLGL